jgi:hypothetical protein
MLPSLAAAALQLVAITHVTVIDVLPREPTTHPNTTVLVAGDRVSSIDATGTTPIPPGPA